MDRAKINQSNSVQAAQYIERKFLHFKKGLYTKASRTKKCREYWIAAETPTRRQLVEDIYQRVFRQLMDTDTAERLEEARESAAAQVVSVESGDWARNKRALRATAASALVTLRSWKSSREYQMGEGFMDRLRAVTAFMEEDELCSLSSFKAEYNAFFEKEITASLERQDGEISHEASFIAAAKQSARISFSKSDLNWGNISAFFEQNFRAGVWANESAKAAWSRSGFSAEVQAAVAIGAQLNIAGEFSWENRDRKLTLGGEGEVFLGARADLTAKLSANALDGFKAAIDAGFFVGLSATVSGTASFSYMGREVASVTGQASLTIGIGGTISASLEAPLFGPTSISFGAGLTLGIGAEAEVEISISFNETRILLTEQFKKLVYLPTLLQGYKMDIQNQEYRNSFYLNKCISRVEAFIGELDEEIRSHKKAPVEKRSLLVKASS